MLAALLVILAVLPNATLPGRRPDYLEHPADGQGTVPTAVGEPAGVPLRLALEDQALWWLAAALVAATLAATLATTTVTVHLVAYLREQHDSAGFAATWTGLLGAGSVGGRILVTLLGRRWPLAATTAVIFVGQALAVVLLLGLRGRAGVVGFVALFGLGVGLISLARAALVADFYGVAAYASINGVLVPPHHRPGRRPGRRRRSPHRYRQLQLVLVAVALCSVVASLAMARAHQLGVVRNPPPASKQPCRR